MTKFRLLAAFAFLGLVAGFVAAAAASTTRHDDQLADLEFVRSHYVLTSQSFTAESRRAALALLDRLEGRAGALSDTSFLVGIASIAATAKNGHDGFYFGDNAWVPPLRLPFRMMWFPDSTVISRAGPAYADLLGARVVSIEGLTPTEIFRRLRELDGGTEAYRTWDAEWMLETPSILNALGIAAHDDRLSLQLVLPGRGTVERTVYAVERSQVPHGVDAPRLWSSTPFAGEGALGFRAANDRSPVPLYLRDPEAPFRMAPLPDFHALYVQFRTNYDAGAIALAPFARDVQTTIERDHPQNLVLDLRFDTGGNNELTRDLMLAIPKNVPGRIYVLTGRYTFSAGIVNVATIKKSGASRATIVGEPVGDNLRWWSESKPVCLPHADLCLHPNAGLWDLAHGCKGEPHCYGDKYDVNVGSIDPQISAPLTARAWLAGADPAMTAIAADLSNSR